MCLGADSEVTPDEDDQVSGVPGHAAITGSTASGSLFNGSDSNQQAGIQASPIVIDPTTGQFVEPTKGRTIAFIPARANNGSGFLGGGPKIFAFFQATDVDLGISTDPGGVPQVVVQTEVKLNRFYRGTVVDPEGPLYIGSIRVGVANLGESTTVVAGVLIVEIQHSEHDLLGVLEQDQNFSTEGVG